MLKIKKLLSIRIISLVILSTFAFSHTAYPLVIKSIYILRVPVDTIEKKRALKAYLGWGGKGTSTDKRPAAVPVPELILYQKLEEKGIEVTDNEIPKGRSIEDMPDIRQISTEQFERAAEIVKNLLEKGHTDFSIEYSGGASGITIILQGKPIEIPAEESSEASFKLSLKVKLLILSKFIKDYKTALGIIYPFIEELNKNSTEKEYSIQGLPRPIKIKIDYNYLIPLLIRRKVVADIEELEYACALLKEMEKKAPHSTGRHCRAEGSEDFDERGLYKGLDAELVKKLIKIKKTYRDFIVSFIEPEYSLDASNMFAIRKGLIKIKGSTGTISFTPPEVNLDTMQDTISSSMQSLDEI